MAEFAIRPFVLAHRELTLRTLHDWVHDPSAYVRRSVANHLNDIARDHPGLVADWLEAHLPHAPAPRRALLKHASRTLIKRGDPRVLWAWGLGAPFTGRATLTVAPHAITLGEQVTLTVALTSTARHAQTLALDYVVHHVRADGGTRPKVFKGWTCTLEAGASRALVKRHAVRVITTRRYHAGVHRVEVQINGRLVTHAAFRLTR